MVRELAAEIINGRRLTRDEDLSFFIDCDLNELMQGADEIRKAYRGERVDLCTIINGKSGKCSENCKFCAQSAHHHTACQEYDLLDEETILEQARANQEAGVNRFSIVDSGYGPNKDDFERIVHTFQRMRDELQINLCCSLGFMSAEQFHRIHEAGVTEIHCNIETSRRNFPNVCTTHTFDDKVENIRRAKAEGLRVCSGGIIGMGETWEDRIDMALTLAELKVDSIPINSLMPIQGTPLAHLARLKEEDILRTIALFRYIAPEADIRLAGGRIQMSDNGMQTFKAGASASITGNMLTTSGSTILQDRTMLTEMGRDVTPDWLPEGEEIAVTA